jgi:hypothetical protein
MAKEKPQVGLVSNDEASAMEFGGAIDSLAATFSAGGNWKVGQVLKGTYIKTKRCFSEKFSGGDREMTRLVAGVETTEYYSDLHILADARDPEQQFGIWSNGPLGAVLERLESGTVLAVRYKGVAEKPLVKGQNPPHEFEYANAEGKPLAPDMTLARRVEIDGRLCEVNKKGELVTAESDVA